MVSGLRQTPAWPSRSRSSLVSSPVRSVSRMSAAPSSTASSRASSRARGRRRSSWCSRARACSLRAVARSSVRPPRRRASANSDQPGMAADGPGNKGSVLLRQGAQGGQAQEQPAQFAAGQRRQLDRDEQPAGAARTRPCPTSSTATGAGQRAAADRRKRPARRPDRCPRPRNPGPISAAATPSAGQVGVT